MLADVDLDGTLELLVASNDGVLSLGFKSGLQVSQCIRHRPVD